MRFAKQHRLDVLNTFLGRYDAVARALGPRTEKNKRTWDRRWRRLHVHGSGYPFLEACLGAFAIVFDKQRKAIEAGKPYDPVESASERRLLEIARAAKPWNARMPGSGSCAILGHPPCGRTK